MNDFMGFNNVGIYPYNESDEVKALNKADTVGNIIEQVVGLGFSIGSNFLIRKAVKKIYEPTTIPEKIATYLGEVAISMAIGACSAHAIHDICHPFEQQKQQKLINNALYTSESTNMVSARVLNMAEQNIATGNLLLKSVYVPDDVPDNGLTMDNLREYLGEDDGEDTEDVDG